MHYIVNPWFFYLIDICDELNIISEVFCCLMFILALGICIAIPILKTEKQDDFVKLFTKSLKNFCIIGIIMFAISIATPSKETCEKMIIASIITEENIDAGKEEAKELIDYVFEKIDELNSGE